MIMPWNSEKPLTASGPTRVVDDARQLHREAVCAFAEFDYARGVSLMAAMTCELAQLDKFALPDRGGCQGCGYHVCSCEEPDT